MKNYLEKHLYNLKLLGVDFIPFNKPPELKKELTNDLSPCANCDYITGKKQIPHCDKKIIILSESPHESDVVVTCFSNDETELLKKMLEAINLKMEDVYITTAFKCCDKNPDIQNCKNILMSELSSFSSGSKYILCFGGLTSLFFLEKETEIEEIRNKVFEFGALRVVFTIKPDNILKASSVKQKELKKMAWSDLKLFQKIISGGG
jgi:uracil-DNA glycosylase family 4